MAGFPALLGTDSMLKAMAGIRHGSMIRPAWQPAAMVSSENLRKHCFPVELLLRRRRDTPDSAAAPVMGTEIPLAGPLIGDSSFHFRELDAEYPIDVPVRVPFCTQPEPTPSCICPHDVEFHTVSVASTQPVHK